MRKLAVRGLPRDVAEAAQIAFSNRTLLVALIGTTLMNLFGFSYTAIVPVWGVESFNASPALIGLLAAAEPAGSLIGGMLIAMRPLPWRPVVVFTVGTSVFIGSVGLAALSPIFAVAWLILAVGGVGSAAFGTMQTLLVMTHAPVEARSRVMGLVTTCIGLGPAGSLALGALSDSIGPAAALALMASIGLAGMALTTRRRVD
jgi:MFS family permease